jgi:signal transduction histidine kinase
MADRLQAFVLTLQRFVADAAHELNTPLTALRNSLDLALEETDEANRALLIKEGRNQVGRLEELAHGLLDLSRLESGESRREKRPVDLGAVVRKSSERYASQAEQAGLAFELALPAKKEPPIVVVGDEGQIGRALANLLDNAVKFTPEGGTIRVGLERDGQQARLWVEDNGIGIAEKELPLLFNRFHRGGNATAYPGSGLGLAIVRSIVRQHGGDVSAENGGRGAIFSIRLPLA